MVNATRFGPMRKRKPPKAWVAYKIAKIGERLGTVYGETTPVAEIADFLCRSEKGSREDRRTRSHLNGGPGESLQLESSRLC
jgi:hypothetical protein